MNTQPIDGVEQQLGWVRDFPDPRDYHIDHPEVKPFLVPSAAFGDDAPALPAELNLKARIKVPPIMNQGQLGSCTANAAVGVYGTYALNLDPSAEQLSRLFVYKNSRMLLNWKGDTGAYLRSAMQALAMFGVLPERFWPYNIANFDVAPDAFAYAMAQNYQALTYYRLDPNGADPAVVLNSIKVNLNANRPVMFGFTVYSNMDNSGLIQLPGLFDTVKGGHAIYTLGYSDTKQIGKSTGALLIANSWGTSYGESGYGWLPYDYVLRRLATDFWTICSAEWLKISVFG